MYQYDDPTVTANLPAATGAGTAGYFTDGNPAGGQAATILRAEFMNMLMMEMVNAISGAGITPSKSTFTQLRSAIEAYITARVASATAAGIVELATTAETQTGTDALRAVTPAGLKSCFTGTNQSLTASGFQRLPGGLIVQWGFVSMVIPDAVNTYTSAPITFPVTFPGALYYIGSTPCFGLFGGEEATEVHECTVGFRFTGSAPFSGCTIDAMRVYGASGGQATGFPYIAVGR